MPAAPTRPHSEFFNSQDSLATEVNGQSRLSNNVQLEGLDNNHRTGMLTVLIDPAKLGTQAALEQEAVAFVDWLRQSPSHSGGVKIAGEPERAARAARSQGGIVVDDATWAELEDAAAKVGL